MFNSCCGKCIGNNSGRNAGRSVESAREEFELQSRAQSAQSPPADPLNPPSLPKPRIFFESNSDPSYGTETTGISPKSPSFPSDVFAESISQVDAIPPSNVTQPQPENTRTADDRGCCNMTSLHFWAPYFIFLGLACIAAYNVEKQFANKWNAVVPDIALNVHRLNCVSEYNNTLNYLDCYLPDESTAFRDLEIVKSCRDSLSIVFLEEKCADSKTSPLIRGKAFYKELKLRVKRKYANAMILRSIYKMCESVFENNPFGDVRVTPAVNTSSNDLFRNDFHFRSRVLLRGICGRTPPSYSHPFAEDRSWYHYPENLNYVILFSAPTSLIAWSVFLFVREMCSIDCNKVYSRPPTPTLQRSSTTRRSTSSTSTSRQPVSQSLALKRTTLQKRLSEPGTSKTATSHRPPLEKRLSAPGFSKTQLCGEFYA